MTDPKSPLDGFFEAAQARPPIPSSDLMARVQADADQQALRTARPAAPEETIRQRILDLWPVWSGCVPAALVGLWIGINPPAGLPDPLLWLEPSIDQVTDLSSDFDDWTWNFEEEGQL